MSSFAEETYGAKMKTDKQQNIEATCMALTVLSELAKKDGHGMLAYLIDIALREAKEAQAKVG